MTSKGWFIINGTRGDIRYTATQAAINGRIEFISMTGELQNIATAIKPCRVADKYSI